MRRAVCCAALSAWALQLALSPIADAASVTAVQGKLLINRGTGYAPVIGTLSVNPGDMLMASPAGRGEIVYDDGCHRAIEPGTVLAVTALSPCASTTAQNPTPHAPTDGWQTQTVAPQATSSSGSQTTWYVLGAAAVGGLAAGAVLATGGSSGSGSGGGGGGSGGGGGPASP